MGQPSTSISGFLSVYRIFARVSLILAFWGVAVAPIWPAEDSDDWPTQYVSPPASVLPRPPVVHPRVQEGDITGSTGDELRKLRPKKKKSLFHRHQEEQGDNPSPPASEVPSEGFSNSEEGNRPPALQNPPNLPEFKPTPVKKHSSRRDNRAKSPSDEQITRVGPADPPAYPDPLLRLSVPIKTEKGIIPAGFYLVRLMEDGSAEKTLLLTREHQILLAFKVHSLPPKSPPEAVQPINPKAPSLLSVRAVVSDDQQSLQIVLKVGHTLFQSDPFATARDLRPVLRD